MNSVSTLFYSYPYLFASALSVIFVTIAGKRLLESQQNALAILSGMTGLPSLVACLMLEGYWAPVRLGGWVLGIEDVLCTYAVGAMAWFAAAFRFGAISREAITFHGFFRRYCIAAGVSAILFFSLYFLRVDAMTVIIMMCLVVGISLFILLPRLRRLALAGAWKFPILYLLLVRIFFMIWPHFAQQWHASTLLGRPFLGLPLGEIIWAVVYGFYWPLFIGYIFEVRLPSG